MSFPHIQKDRIVAGRRWQRRTREIGLRRKLRALRVVLTEDAVHVHAAWCDLQVLAVGIDLDLKVPERRRRVKRCAGHADDVGRRRAFGMVCNIGLLVQLGVEDTAPLLRANLAVVIADTKRRTAEVTLHVFLRD